MNAGASIRANSTPDVSGRCKPADFSSVLHCVSQMSLSRDGTFKKARQPAAYLSFQFFLRLCCGLFGCSRMLCNVISALLSPRFDGAAEDLGHGSRAELAGDLG